MKRVVVTGLGITSCLGTDKHKVLESLQQGISGISFQEPYVAAGLKSHVAGSIDADLSVIDRKHKRFMGDAAAFSYLSMQQAIEDSQLPHNLVSNTKTGIIVGNGGGSSLHQVQAWEIAAEKGIKKMGPYQVARTMCSTAVAALSTFFEIKGVNYSISSACATSSHCIGNAYELIQMGKQTIMFAGGGEEESVQLSGMFDAMGTLSSKYNDTPASASRPYDASRDGFVIAGGGGILVLEELEHALARGAKIYGEIVGYGATSDGFDMVAPSGEGAKRCIEQALSSVDVPVDYINTHGTSTPVGDIKELNAIGEVFTGNIPMISSTKSLSGHSLGAAGVHEAIYSLLMMEHNFIAASANISQLDEQAKDMNIVQQRKDNIQINCIMSTNFGFGGTNATLVFKKFAD